MDFKELIDFDFNPSFYAGEGRRALDDGVVMKNIAKLNEASDSLIKSMGEIPDVDFEKILSYLLREFKAKTSVANVVISKAELRALSYHLDSNWDYPFLKWCLDIVDQNWASINLRGLLHSLLAHWEEGGPDGHKLLLDSVMRHIEQDKSKTSESIRPIKDSIKNPYKLGVALRKQGLDVYSACGLFSLPVNRITYGYFSNVIIAYYAKPDINELDDLFKVLHRHNNVKTDKTVIPDWIVSFGAKGLPDELRDFAIHKIGDPFAKEKWAPFPLATREETNKLEQARRILANAISSKIINIFFQELCNDKSRRVFWSKYTDKVSDFSVYGSESSLSAIRFKFDPEVLQTHFRLVSNFNTTNCALVMEISDYTIIEFTDTGAMYAYKNDSASYKKVFDYRIDRLEELKIPSLNTLISFSGEIIMKYNDEGRMVHSGHWQRRLSRWIDRKIK